MSKNKIFAVSFLGLACFCFFGYYLLAEIDSSFAFFRNSDWTVLLFFLLDAVMYLILLVANIRNDDFAYTGIALFVSMETFSFIQELIYGQISSVNILTSGNPLLIVFYVFYILFLTAEAGTGAALYVFVVRYQRGYPNFKFVRIFGILFACFIGLASLVSSLMLVLALGPNLVSSLSLLMSAIAIPLAETCASVGIVFTLERLKRI